ncbi:LysR family transcriptional regulator [Cohnella fermenti]|uniref:LysR family transcriptional regulator n=1 Tax=Cohnella fermenti TaxID=2565925 RepID=A0A4S4C9R2_9BACL|nr:LysR family transcriptional regulator [Cohnella fermenti]THF84106.1 LysR family transcriptional regulator [Cohnella fermenti]
MDAQLEVFEAVARLRSFSKAAERLHITQPAVSQQIRALEDSLGVRLLERTNKAVSLTNAGEIALRHAKEINGLYRAMSERIGELMNCVGGPIAIGASYTFGEYALPPALARLHRDYPDIRPTIAIGNTAEIADRLRARELDIGIVEGEDVGTGLRSEKLADDEMVLAAAPEHPIAGVRHPSPARLAEETWLVREEGSGTRAATDRLLAAMGVRPVRLMELGSTQLIKEMAEAGLGITLQSRLALRKELKLGTLRVLGGVSGTPFRREFRLLLRNGEPMTRSLDAFLGTLRLAATELLGEQREPGRSDKE